MSAQFTTAFPVPAGRRAATSLSLDQIVNLIHANGSGKGKMMTSVDAITIGVNRLAVAEAEVKPIEELNKVELVKLMSTKSNEIFRGLDDQTKGMLVNKMTLLRTLSQDIKREEIINPPAILTEPFGKFDPAIFLSGDYRNLPVVDIKLLRNLARVSDDLPDPLALNILFHAVTFLKRAADQDIMMTDGDEPAGLPSELRTVIRRYITLERLRIGEEKGTGLPELDEDELTVLPPPVAATTELKTRARARAGGRDRAAGRVIRRGIHRHMTEGISKYEMMLAEDPTVVRPRPRRPLPPSVARLLAKKKGLKISAAAANAASFSSGLPSPPVSPLAKQYGMTAVDIEYATVGTPPTENHHLGVVSISDSLME
ncbi:uncharacterized protein E0L32_004221 [Thyridium curvatum]|uniref:Uncharacterized protein n=1 Tax=Thyridium curvatum TaxID=1093900 RepID=A0A507BAI5_9PEZI|nr:uncharacterized protein E0L32_004221 [Thyridium curvatum]TPX16226.1 hypothetical protein E0L32_004221 [Thyridium curvatum]